MITLSKIEPIAGIAGPMRVYLLLDFDRRIVKDVKVETMEGARFFEVILRGENVNHVPFIASRICGICGYAHAICSAMAIESALGIDPPDSVSALREIVAMLSTMNSHIYHLSIMLLARLSKGKVPSGYPELKRVIIELIRLKSSIIDRALQLICGHPLHPRNIVPGGFARLPSLNTILFVLDELNKLRRPVEYLLEYMTTLQYPKIADEFVSHYAALRGSKRHSLLEGYIFLDLEFKVSPADFKERFRERPLRGSASKVCLLSGKESYMVGALARANVHPESYGEYRPWLRNLPSTNPYLIPIAQAVEILRFIDLVQDLKFLVRSGPRRVRVPRIPQRARGVSVIEAPRGLLYHEYDIVNCKIYKADIITPTVQNIANMRDSIEYIIGHTLQSLRSPQPSVLENKVEEIVQCYDPCIPCAVHVRRL